jgi:integrase/recombinase XerD
LNLLEQVTKKAWRSVFQKRELPLKRPNKKNPKKMKPKDLPIHPTSEILLKEFTQYLKVSGYSFAKSSASAVREMLWWMEKEGIRLEEIERESMQKYYTYLVSRPNYLRAGSLSVHTIDNYLFTLKLFFSYLQKVGLKAINPMSVLQVNHHQKGTRKERSVLTKSEINTLYRVCKNELEKVLLGMFYGCGLRKSEVEKLNIKDLDLSKNGAKCLYVRSGKGRKRRVVPLTQNVMIDVKNYLQKERTQRFTYRTKPADKKALLLNKNGTRMLGNSLWTSFKTMLLRTTIKKEISLHHLRHTIATHLLAEGMDIEGVRDFLGHQHLESTQIYTRVNQNQLKI